MRTHAQYSETAVPVESLGWCAPATMVGDLGHRWVQAIRREAAGYLSMTAFLLAYGLMVIGAGQLVQSVLNLGGGVLAVCYLLRKGAVPSVIGNTVWVVLTLVRLALQ